MRGGLLYELYLFVVGALIEQTDSWAFLPLSTFLIYYIILYYIIFFLSKGNPISTVCLFGKGTSVTSVNSCNFLECSPKWIFPWAFP